MNLQAYRTLVEIAERGSFSRVAERLNMTLSAVSMQMKTLERDLDVPVFDRTVRPPKLTPLGRDIAEQARIVVAADDRLAALARMEGLLRGAYRIGIIPTASVRLLPGFLAEAQRQVPAARFSIETGLTETLMDKVSDGRLDAVVVTRGTSDVAGLSYRAIRREEIVYALPEGRGSDSLERCFATLPFILFAPGSGIGRLIAAYLSKRPKRPGTTMTLDSVEAIMECVNAGIGFAALPRPDVERYGREGVTIAALDHQPLDREIALVTATGSFSERQIDLLTDLLAGPATD